MTDETLPCLILDVTDCEDWATHQAGGARIPPGRSPTVLQKNAELAEQEALRLARRFPGRTFAVCEARVIAKAVKVPTHVTVDGREFASQLIPTLMDVVPIGAFPPF